MVVFLDRLTKTIAVTQLSDGHAEPFIPGVVDFQLVYNSGAAWGVLDGARLFFVVLAAAAVIAFIVYLWVARPHATLHLLALGFIAGGAIGNAVDRALYGEVTDFIHTLFIAFPYFNVADSAITIGAIFLIASILFSGRSQVVAEKPEAAESDVGDAGDMSEDAAKTVAADASDALEETDDAR